MISEHLNENNLHHAYLIEGAREEIVPQVYAFVESLGIKTKGNPDFVNISIDNFKMDEALDLRSMASEKGFSNEKNAKKIFVISANTFSLDAEGTLLKMFEEPIDDTHFFLIVPDSNILLRTLVSRFYLVSARQGLAEEIDKAKEFIAMPLKSRIDFLKELLAEEEVPTEVGIPTGVGKVLVIDSARPRALNFLNAVETVLHKKLLLKSNPDNRIDCFEQIFKAREFLRQPGSSTKSLMESVALVIPSFSN